MTFINFNKNELIEEINEQLESMISNNVPHDSWNMKEGDQGEVKKQFKQHLFPGIPSTSCSVNYVEQVSRAVPYHFPHLN